MIFSVVTLHVQVCEQRIFTTTVTSKVANTFCELCGSCAVMLTCCVASRVLRALPFGFPEGSVCCESNDDDVTVCGRKRNTAEHLQFRRYTARPFADWFVFRSLMLFLADVCGDFCELTTVTVGDVMLAQAEIDCLVTSATEVAAPTEVGTFAKHAQSLLNSALMASKSYAKAAATAATWLYHDHQ
jgi:hypothetical protein